jgi:hypothetical protein
MHRFSQRHAHSVLNLGAEVSLAEKEAHVLGWF